MQADIPEPWRSFCEMSTSRWGRDEADSESPLELHCVGGFVIAVCYNLARTTADLDVFGVVPAHALRPLLQRAGVGTALAKKHGLYIDAGSRVATLPEGYVDRLIELFPGSCRHLKLFALDPYDLALSKLERNIDRDREDVLYLARTPGFGVRILRERYLAEVRPFVTGPVIRHDGTLALWIEMIDESREKAAGP